MDLKPHFTQGREASRLFKWKTQDCEIHDSQGGVVFSMKRVKAPAQWSSLAIEIAAAKYFRKTGVGRKKHENSVLQMVERVVSSIKKSGLNQRYFQNKKQAEIFASELTFILLDQRAFFNSPVWFNCGLQEAYGITSQSEQWAWDEKAKKTRPIGEAFSRPQISACFIQGVEDHLESIFELAKTEARLFKFGSGSGTNFSKIRSKYDSLEGGGQSSGLISFLEVLDRGAGSIKSGGTKRRAAKMVCLDVDHPEILEFICWKSTEEKKARILAQAGYGEGIEDESYRTVSGQNSNNSVRVSDSFMKALAQEGEWSLRSPTSSKVLKKLKAYELWEAMATSAWECADPGLQFDDTIQRWHTCKNSGVIRASNPCSEFMFLDDSACNLASLNLLRFFSPTGTFDLESYLHTIKVIFLAQEILVDLAGYPTEKIARNTHDFRPLGIGLSGVGAFLMQMGVAYDSEAGRNWASCLSSILTAQAYEVSALLALQKKPYASFRLNQKPHLTVLQRHAKAARSISACAQVPKEISETAKALWLRVLPLAKKNGLRNAQVSVMAPTGTIGLVMDSDTTGIEPEFSLIKQKKLSGGGNLRLVSQSFEIGLRRLGYTEEQILDIKTQVEVTGRLQISQLLDPAHEKVFLTAMEISPLAHLQMMAAIQPYISGSISKTINMPIFSTVENIKEIYQAAWTFGLKSIAIYRDGSKLDQPLQSLSVPKKQRDFSLKCSECGAPTEFAGGCFRCVNCGNVMGCA